ncbi:unnamed protein product, partial [marine sediment metagenome]
MMMIIYTGDMIGPVPSEEGYRIIWILDSLKQDLDGQKRQSKIEKTI